MKRKVSIYVKGDRNSVSYYRIYQYFDKIDNIELSYHLMSSQYLHNHFFPFNKQNVLIKVVIFFNMILRMGRCLLHDFLTPPNIMVVHRRILVKFMPSLYFYLLKETIKRGCKLIWDFDDNILESREISAKNFYKMAQLSSVIVVTHETLASLVPLEFKNKIQILHTTDGDMYKYYLSNRNNLDSGRVYALHNNINLVWVATSTNLKYLENISEILEKIAEEIQVSSKKTLSLKVVCDKPLLRNFNFLQVENIKWSRKNAQIALYESQIGIMPLEDSVFTRGKGGFKLVQYMSVGLPCIASAVGFNNKVINNNSGFIVSNIYEDWKNAILKLSNLDDYLDYSRAAFDNWRKFFNYEDNLLFWKRTLEIE